MNMLIAISETVLLRWRESPDFNLLLVTFVKEVEVRETTCARGDGEEKGRSRYSRLPPDAARRWPAATILLLRRRLKWQQSWKMLSVTVTGQVRLLHLFHIFVWGDCSHKRPKITTMKSELANVGVARNLCPRRRIRSDGEGVSE